MPDRREERSDAAASTAIRDALPTPDDIVVDRMSARIAAEAPTPVASATARAFPPRRARWRVRAGITACALGAAALIALLAPSREATTERSGGLPIGPDVAAAEVLDAAGDIAAREQWHALRDDEWHYSRSVEHQPDQYLDIATEEWIASDGSTRLRITEQSTVAAVGATYFMPATTCRGPREQFDFQTAVSSGEPVPVGSAPLACWQREFDSVGLQHAVGRVVAAPPAGAAIGLPMNRFAFSDGRPLRMGIEVFEGRIGPETGPGGMSGSQNGAPPTFHPYHLLPSTSWIEVESRPTITTDIEMTPAQRNIRDTQHSDVTSAANWHQAFSIDELADLPTDDVALARRLRDEARTLAAEADAPIARPAPESTTTWIAPGPKVLRFAPQFQHDSGTFAISLATSLLVSAPASPELRSAAFRALAHLDREGHRANVVSDAELPGGGPAVGIQFPIPTPERYAGPEDDDDGVLLLLDPRSGDLRAVELRLDWSTYLTEWDAPERVSSIPPVPTS